MYLIFINILIYLLIYGPSAGALDAESPKSKNCKEKKVVANWCCFLQI